LITSILADVGQGKTQTAVLLLALDFFKWDRQIISNISLKFPKIEGKKEPIALNLGWLYDKHNWPKLFHTTVLFDDIDEFLSDNRRAMSNRNQIINALAWSHRKASVHIIYTAHQQDPEGLRSVDPRLYAYSNRYIYPTAIREEPQDYAETPSFILSEVFNRDPRGVAKKAPGLLRIDQKAILAIGEMYDTTEILIDPYQSFRT